jgi:hypothetical protein
MTRGSPAGGKGHDGAQGAGPRPALTSTTTSTGIFRLVRTGAGPGALSIAADGGPVSAAGDPVGPTRRSTAGNEPRSGLRHMEIVPADATVLLFFRSTSLDHTRLTPPGDSPDHAFPKAEKASPPACDWQKHRLHCATRCCLYRSERDGCQGPWQLINRSYQPLFATSSQCHRNDCFAGELSLLRPGKRTTFRAISRGVLNRSRI